MSESPESTSTSPWKSFLPAITVGVLVVVAAIIAQEFFIPSFSPQTGIIYPHDRQQFTQLPLSFYSNISLNQTALQEAVRINGEQATVSSVSSDSMGLMGHRYRIGLELNEGDEVSIDTNAYNQHRSDALPEGNAESIEGFEQLDGSPTWVYSKQEVFIDSVSDTDNSQLSDREFRVQINGNNVSGSESLHVFSIGIIAEEPVSEEDQSYRYSNCLYGTYDTNDLDWSLFKRRKVSVREQDKSGITFSVDADWGRENSCFLVSLQEDADSLKAFAESKIVPAKATLSIKELFNPDLNFKSVLNVQFSTAFFDTKKLRSGDEFLRYRGEQKRRLAALISASPSVSVDPEDIVLYSNRAEIPLDLKEETVHSITLASGKDVYGQPFEKQVLSVTTGELTYLGFKQHESQAVFMDSALPTIDVVHYDVENPTLKLCRVGLESYAKIEQIVSRRSQYDFSERFLLEGIDNLPVQECFDQDIELSADSVRTPVDLTQMIGSPGRSGLYFLTFAFQGQRKLNEKTPVVSPLFFSIVDAHISMKLSESGKAFFWVNDLQTGEGVPGLTLRAYHNEFSAFESRWNSGTQQTDETYFSPLDESIYSSLGEIGRTDANGFLEVDLSREDYMEAFNSWYDDPSHRSLAITANNDDHLTYVVSKWNSGIAGWNFGFEPRSWDVGSQYSAHLVTDRMLYSPGETVHFKAIIRENADQLRIPTGTDFELTLYDGEYNTVFQKSIQLNDFGSYLEDIELGEDAALGVYRIQLRGETEDGMEYIRNGEFNVEEFKKPTFKVDVSVDSPDLEDQFFSDPSISNERTEWGYSYKTYSKALTLKADVMASYYSGGLLPNAPYTYQVFKQYYYDTSFWNDCYYGCFWEPEKDYVTEGNGTLDSAGKASIEIPITHETRWSDYRYIVEVAVNDPSSQQVAGSGSVIAKVPSELRQYNPTNKIEMEVDKQFVPKGESITLSLRPERKWREANNDQYQVTLVQRTFTTKHNKQVGGDIVPQVDYQDNTLETILVNTSTFSESEGMLSKSFKLTEDGEYHLQVTQEGGGYSNLIKIYSYDPNGVTNAPVVADNKIKVLTEKTSYHLGETARLFVRLPFSDGKALITIEKKNVINKEIVDISGNTLIKEYTIDDTFMPNAYISVIAFKPSNGSGMQPEYKVGYAEVVVDKTDKKLNISSSSDREEYQPREEVSLNLKATDKDGNGVRSELMVAVVDEALIAIMGNIDMDILPKFFQKIVFQTHTALTNVAMMKHLYFARKGIIGGSGAKDGGDSIFTRTNFKNTAFYAGAVNTAADGTATVSFELPDNIGDFRVITIGHSKSNFFGATEQTISVRQDIVVEETFPLIVRVGDQMRVGATVFNNSSEAKEVNVSLDSDGLLSEDSTRQTVSIPASQRKFLTWRVSVNDAMLEEVEYTITAAVGSTGGDRIQKTVPVAKSPLIANRIHLQDDFQVASTQKIDFIDDINFAQSTVELRLSNTLLIGVEKAMHSLLVYPYGCIEQTISSTLPNAIVSKFNNILEIGISPSALKKNLEAGIERFRKMQTDDGGFSYWPGSRESDAHVTPYVLLALVQMRDLGVDIPADIISKAQGFVENQVKSLSGSIPEDRLSQLVHETHALAKLDSQVFNSARILVQNRTGQLSMHERIIYALALAKQDAANYEQEIDELIDSINLSKAGDSNRNWYWNQTSDKALFAQLLLLTDSDPDQLRSLVKELYELDLTSYYHSTQAKIQSFILFADYIQSGKAGKASGQTVVTYEFGKKTGSVRLTERSPFKKLIFPLSEVTSSQSTSLEFSIKGETDQRIYSDLLVFQIPTDPNSVPAQQDKGVKVSRQYFKLGEIKEDEDDNWWTRAERDLAPVSSSSFTLGETYMVKIKIDYEREHRELALESYLPAGFRLLNPRFNTDQTQVGEDLWSWPYNYRERRSDRFFASARYAYDTEQELTYFVRAEIPGTFLEPPVSAYPMYHPEVEGHTAFRTITVKE